MNAFGQNTHEKSTALGEIHTFLAPRQARMGCVGCTFPVRSRFRITVLLGLISITACKEVGKTDQTLHSDQRSSDSPQKELLVAAIGTVQLPNLAQPHIIQQSLSAGVDQWVGQLKGNQDPEIVPWVDRLRNVRSAYLGLKACRNSIPSTGIMHIKTTADGPNPTYDFGQPSQGYARRSLSHLTDRLITNLSLGATLHAKPLGPPIVSIDAETYLYNLHRKILLSTNQKIEVLDKLLQNPNFIRQQVKRMNTAGSYLNHQIAWATIESSEANLSKYWEQYFTEKPENITPAHAAAVANRILTSPSFDATITEDAQEPGQTEWEGSYTSVHAQVVSDPYFALFLAIPSVQKVFGSKVRFDDETPWESKPYTTLRTMNRILVRQSEEYTDDLKFDSVCPDRAAGTCKFSLSSGSMLHTKTYHKRVGFREVLQGLATLQAIFKDRQEKLKAIHNDDYPEASLLRRSRLGLYSGNEAVESLPGFQIPNVLRFQRIYMVLRYLIAANPILAGKQLAEFVNADLGVGYSLSDIHCNALRVVDFEANGSKVIEKASKALGLVSLAVPGVIAIRAAFALRGMTLGRRIFKAATIGIGSTAGGLSFIPYLVGVQGRWNKHNALVDFNSALLAELRHPLVADGRESAIADLAASVGEVRSVIMEVLIAAAARGGLGHISSGVSLTKKVMRTPRHLRIQSPRGLAKSFRSMAASLRKKCGT